MSLAGAAKQHIGNNFSKAKKDKKKEGGFQRNYQKRTQSQNLKKETKCYWVIKKGLQLVFFKVKPQEYLNASVY